MRVPAALRSLLTPGPQRVLPGTVGPYAARAPAGARAVVVGGGLAGVAAATVLAERGLAVTLLEREPQLGGRVGAWRERLRTGEPVEVERGFHAFFRQYYNLRALLRRIDPALQRLVPLGDYPLLGPHDARASFADLPRRAPFNVAAVAWRSPHLRLGDLPRIQLAPTLEMLAYDPAHTPRRWDDVSARAYLDALGFRPAARQMLFNVFAHSFFNPEEDLSAAELLMQFHFYFTANPEGLLFDVLDAPYGRGLWEPLHRHLEQHGAQVLLGRRALRVGREGGRWRVEVEGLATPLPADAVVLAMEVPALQTLVAASPDLDDAAWRQTVAGLRVTLPFAVWRLWLDRRVGSDRAPFAGTTGFGLLDNVSVYERFQDEGRQWATLRGGSVLELHAYAVPEGLDESALRRELMHQLHALYPETRGTRVLDDRFQLRRDCPAFPPGHHARRPTPTTPFEGVTVAGDFVRTPFPCALMERAVSSGFLAANALLARWQLRPEELWSVPPQGLLASWRR